MSEFDKQDAEVIGMVNANPRRRGVIRDVGYIVTREQAEQMAVAMAARKRSSWKDTVAMAIAALVVVLTTVAALAG